MEKLATENLFLLEFLVDDIKMDGRCDCDTPPGEQCVSFQFLDNDPLDVCEADFTPGRKYGKDDNTKNGKSCLFSLTPEQVQKATEVFDVVISVFKKMQPGWLPEKICIGSALISIANLFVELIQSVELQTEQAPSAKTLKDTFELADTTGNNVGKICIYIRMSCFGKLIVTQFQMNLDDKSVLFKDKGGQSLYRYKKARKNGDGVGEINGTPPPNYLDQQPTQQQLQPPPPMYNQAGNFASFNRYDRSQRGFPQEPHAFPPMQDVGMFGPQSPQSAMFPPVGGQSMLPCSECTMLQMPSFDPQQPSFDPQQPSFEPPRPPCYDPSQMLTPCEECGTLLAPKFNNEVCPPPPDVPGNYQEIGASMGGNALTIRVHKDKNKIEQVDGSEASEASCCCTPGNIGAKKNKKEGPCPPVTSQTYNMGPGLQQGDKNLPFSFKMGGAGFPPNNNVVVNPPVCTRPDGTKCVEISDPNKEMFVLRIGKKSEGVQKKANLELELCTPKAPELKPIPKKETRDSQYDPMDCPDGKKGKSGGKGGKGKKGKGKKGKKK
ncbi:DUF4497 domain containing protein [Asbolus verrucosus]|uniref:DUF4497 domain containing protein n=1 Tax=Asbolus verrucosus TaxID=1661398 RepID=A0A482VYW9_ASBVE|nr:DUF4497 domain containing protein [Asbolus verrucosus]